MLPPPARESVHITVWHRVEGRDGRLRRRGVVLASRSSSARPHSRTPEAASSAPVTRRLDSPPSVASLSFRDRELAVSMGSERGAGEGGAQACARLTVN